MATNEFLPFATGAGANVITQAAYAALTSRTAGFQAGIAKSAEMSKVWRQSSAMAAALGAFINAQGYDALDNGDIVALTTNFISALQVMIQNVSPRMLVYCGNATGTANAIVLTPSPAITSYGGGVGYIFVASATNTGNTTINISGLGPITVYKDTEVGQGGLSGGEIRIGSMCLARFDGTYLRLEDSQLGTAALQNSSLGTPGGTVASVTGAIVAGHFATFADTGGTLQDGGAPGQAAFKAVSDNTKGTVASVNGATVVGRIATFVDTAGTVQDSGTALTSLAPLANPTFTGDPKAPTPTQFDNDTSLATTAFVQQALGNMSGYIGLSGNTALTASQAGKAIICSSVSNFTVTLPAANAMPLAAGGGIFHLLNSGGTGTVTINAAGTDPIYVNGTGTVSTLTLAPGEDIVLLALGSGGTYWYTFGGTAQLKYAAGFAASLGAAGSSGYQKLPSGLIIQWGYVLGSAQPFSVTFPLAFPSAAYVVTVGGNGLSTSNVTGTINSLSQSGFQATCWSGGAASTNSSVAIYWTALGK